MGAFAWSFRVLSDDLLSTVNQQCLLSLISLGCEHTPKSLIKVGIAQKLDKFKKFKESLVSE